MDLGLTGRACRVTGATRGIGLATARTLCAEGARVLVVSRDRDDAARVAAELQGEAEPLGIDVTTPDAGPAVVSACRERFGAGDGLVNNAGTSRQGPPEGLSEGGWREQPDPPVVGPERPEGA